MDAAPDFDPCERCGQVMELRLSIDQGFDGGPVDHEIRIYRCRCTKPPVKILERFGGSGWTWRDQDRG